MTAVSPPSKWISRRMESIYNVDVAERLARRKLPRVVFDYVAGGAGDETTLNANRSAFRRIELRPRVAGASMKPDLSVTVVGANVATPILLSPCGGVRLVHPDGDRALARAAEAVSTVATISMASATSLEDVAEASGAQLWFQLYLHSDHGVTTDLIERAQKSGYRALVITMDTAVQGNRERDRRHRAKLPLTVSLRNAVRFGPQMALHPTWLYGYVRDGTPTSFGSLPASVMDRSMTITTWTEVEWIREAWDGPLIVKGILDGTDARRAAGLGADAVVVSNHGGRQLDGAPASIAALPSVRRAVGERFCVLLDGGIRRGGDVVRAIALGANAVMIGRPYLYGLAAGGQHGVERIVQLLTAELERDLILMGHASVASLDASSIDARHLQKFDWADLPPERITER